MESNRDKGGEVYVDTSNQFVENHPSLVASMLHAEESPPAIEVGCITYSMFFPLFLQVTLYLWPCCMYTQFANSFFLGMTDMVSRFAKQDDVALAFG